MVSFETQPQTTSREARHSSKTAEWYTPDYILEPARKVLRGIDLDPASCYEANQKVKAKGLFDILDNGLELPWYQPIGVMEGKPASLWLNPPGGKIGNKSLVKLFWQKLMDEVEAGHISHALFLCFSIEAAQTTQLGCSASILDFPICWFNRRVAYVDASGQPIKGNTHASCLVYVPGAERRVAEFHQHFHTLGRITDPAFFRVYA